MSFRLDDLVREMFAVPAKVKEERERNRAAVRAEYENATSADWGKWNEVVRPVNSRFIKFDSWDAVEESVWSWDLDWRDLPTMEEVMSLVDYAYSWKYMSIGDGYGWWDDFPDEQWGYVWERNDTIAVMEERIAEAERNGVSMCPTLPSELFGNDLAADNWGSGRPCAFPWTEWTNA